MCAAMGFTDASRAYEMADGRRLVLPLLRRSVGPVRALRGLQPAALRRRRAPRAGRAAPGRDRRRPARPRRAPGARAHVLAPAPARRAVGRAASRAAPSSSTAAPTCSTWSRAGTRCGRRASPRSAGAGCAPPSGAASRSSAAPRASSLPEFYGLLELATARWARMQHEPRWLTMARLRGRDPMKKFQAAARSLGARFRVWIASVDGRPMAGLVVLQGRNAYYFRGAMDETMRDHRPNDLLHARAIEDACQAGCGAYYMGDSGWSPSAAVVQGAVRRPAGALPRVPLRAPAALAHGDTRSRPSSNRRSGSRISSDA